MIQVKRGQGVERQGLVFISIM